jgi:hypothetical protein
LRPLKKKDEETKMWDENGEYPTEA